MGDGVTSARKGELVRKLFEILLSEPDGLRAGVAIQRLASAVQLTSHEAGHYESGARRFDKIVRFSTISFVKAGWLAKVDGVWLVTEEGKQAFAKHRGAEEFRVAASRLYQAWKKSTARTVDGEDDEVAAADEARSVTFEEAEDQAWSDIEQHLNSIDPYEFQKLVGDLLTGMKYHVAWIAPPGKDGGVDIVAFTDPLGTQAPRIKIQVKRLTSNRVDVDGVRAFLATIGTSDVGIFVSLAGFTRGAQDYVRDQETRRVTLVDARRLVDLWVEHYDRLSDQARQRLPLTPIYFLTPA
ncbi:MAG: restriction endonuclease [Hyphomonadaceae bacterium]